MDRKLFWTDRGSDNGVPPKVASADMDGGNLKNLFTENLVNVGYITTDISASKVYWGVASTGVVCSHLLFQNSKQHRYIIHHSQVSSFLLFYLD